MLTGREAIKRIRNRENYKIRLIKLKEYAEIQYQSILRIRAMQSDASKEIDKAFRHAEK